VSHCSGSLQVALCLGWAYQQIVKVLDGGLERGAPLRNHHDGLGQDLLLLTDVVLVYPVFLHLRNFRLLLALLSVVHLDLLERTVGHTHE
jgi:hypothetical protein